MKNIMHQHTVDCAKDGRNKSVIPEGKIQPCAAAAQEVRLTLTHIICWARFTAGHPSHAVSISSPFTLLI